MDLGYFEAPWKLRGLSFMTEHPTGSADELFTIHSDGAALTLPVGAYHSFSRPLNTLHVITSFNPYKTPQERCCFNTQCTDDGTGTQRGEAPFLELHGRVVELRWKPKQQVLESRVQMPTAGLRGLCQTTKCSLTV